MIAPRRRGGWSELDVIAAALLIAVAVAIAFVDFYVRRNPSYALTTYIPQVLAGTYEAPFIYRPLAPWIIRTAIGVSGLSPLATFVLLRLVAILGALVLFYAYLRTWFSAEAGIGATMAMAALLPFTLTNSWPVPGTYLELAMFSAGALAIVRGRDWLFAGILLVASLNRETSAFLLALWVVARAGSRRWPRWVPLGAAMGVAWTTVFIGLRWLYGFKTYTVFVLGRNLAFMNVLDTAIDPRLRVFAWFWVAMLGVPAYLAVRGARDAGADIMMRAGCWVGFAFVAAAMAAGSIVEPRVLLPAFPLFAPAALHYCVGSARARVAL